MLNALPSHRKGLSALLEHLRFAVENNAFEGILRVPVISRHLSFRSGGPRSA